MIMPLARWVCPANPWQRMPACSSQGYGGYKTMPEAVALMQPRRVILTFGTNDLSSSYSASSFASDYA